MGNVLLVKQSLRLVFCSSAILFGLSGCGWLWGDEGYFRDRSSDYLTARSTEALDVPSDIEKTRPLDPLLAIPGNVPNEKDVTHFETPRPRDANLSQKLDEFSLQKVDGTSFIAAQYSALNVFPLASAFLEKNKFAIVTKKIETGDLITDWQPLTELSAPLSHHLVTASGAGELSEIRVRIRVEPSTPSNTSEIFIVSAVRNAGDTTNVEFTNPGANKKIDQALSEELLVSLARNAPLASNSVASSSEEESQEASVEAVNRTQNSQGDEVLLFNTDFNRTWSDVGAAIDDADIKVIDLDRTQGVYYIDFSTETEDEKGFFSGLFGSDESDLDGHYEIHVDSISNQVQVSVENDAGKKASDDATNAILTKIQENIH